jgi:phosphoglycerate dehydrogenase-like enzyme
MASRGTWCAELVSDLLRVSVPDESWAATLGDDPRLDLVVWDVESPQPPGRLDLVLVPYTVEPPALARLDVSRIGLVQGQWLGYDGFADAVPAGGTYANAVGVHEESTAELAVALLLASQRGIDEYARERGQWEPRWSPSLADRRVLLLGVGGIGSEVARRLGGFGVELVRVGSRRREDADGVVHGTDELPGLLPTVEVVVIAVPLSPATTNLVDDAFLAALPDGAVVVNVSRGKVVDTEAVVRQAGRLRYATDVTEPEPLPPDHALWTVPGVLITPHVGGSTSAMRPRVERLVRRQIEHLLAGREPDHVVVRP